MNVTHKITMDLTRPTNENRINVVEGDKNSRIVNVHLYENFASWRVPTNASVLIKWERESGVGGEYSQLSDGSSAWSAVGNILTITLSDESTEYSGNVKFSIVLTSGDSQISTFVIIANVHAVANGREGANSGTSSSDIAGLQKQIGNLSDLETKNKSNLVAAINEAAKSGGGSGETGADGGYYTPKVSQPSTNTMLVEHTPSKAGMPAVEPVTINLPVGSGSSQNVALTTEQINALDGMFKVCAFIKDDVSAEYNAFQTAFGISDSGGEEEPDEPVTPEKTLTGISATYSGGDVAVGTAVSALTGIVVTAHYSDGTSATVTGYTLSGEIAEGSNTVTATYQGKTATFIVAGVAESGGTEALPTDGLVDYFDFRTVEYNNSGAGGSTTIAPTQGNGQLYGWAKDCVTEQSEDYGLKVVNRSMMYSSAGNTTQTECGTSFTWAFASYLIRGSTPLFSNDYGALSNDGKLVYKPKYNTSTSTAQVAGETLGGRVDGYDYIVLTVNDSVCKLYFGDELVKTVDGNDMDGFTSWYSKLACSVLGSNDNGYLTHLAVYNKALSDIEITELVEYLKGLEVA